MAEELELETPVDVEVEDPAVTDPTDPEPAKDEPFLSVNERTAYKTREEAVRGYNEAASRIAQLSAWEKQAKQYGLSDPRQLDAVAQELLQLRKEKAEAAKQAGVAPAKADPADPKAKETEQVRKYLKDLGYISKSEQDEALKELREQIQEMREMGTQSEEMRFQNQEAEARNEVGTWLSADGVKDDGTGTKLAVVGTLIKDWINTSDERVEQWSRGGVSAKSLVKEGYDFAMKALGWKAAAQPALKPTDPGYAAAKAKAMAANKKLPQPGTAKGEAKKAPPKQKGHITAELHEKAWEMFNSGE